MTLLLLVLFIVIIYYFFIYKEAYKNIFDNNSRKCPNCGNHIEANYNVCPVCKETLKKKCQDCGNMVNANWKYCPYCKTTLRKGGTE